MKLRGKNMSACLHGHRDVSMVNTVWKMRYVFLIAWLAMVNTTEGGAGQRFYNWMNYQTEFPIGAWSYVSGQTQDQAWFNTYRAAGLNIIQANTNQLTYTKAAGLNVALGTWDGYQYDYQNYNPTSTVKLLTAIALATNPANRITIFLVKDDLPEYYRPPTNIPPPYTNYYHQYDAFNHIVNQHIYPGTPSSVMVQADFLPVWAVSDSRFGTNYWTLIDQGFDRCNLSVAAHCNYPILTDPAPQGSTAADYFEQLEGFRNRSRDMQGDIAPGLFGLVSLASFNPTNDGAISRQKNRQASTSDANWQVNCQLAYGAKGIWWYNYQRKPSGMEIFGDGFVDTNGNKTALYAMCSNINVRVLNWGKTLKNPDLESTSVSFVPNSTGGIPSGVDTYQFGDASDYFDVTNAPGGLCIAKFDWPWVSQWYYVMVVNMQHGGNYYAQSTFDRTFTGKFHKRLLAKRYVSETTGSTVDLNMPPATGDWHSVNFTLAGGAAKFFAFKKPKPGLTGRWELNGSGIDNSGLGHNAWLYGGYSSLIRKEGEYSYHFNGVNSYAEVVDDSHLDIGTGNFGISLWFRREPNASGNLRVLSKGAVNDTDTGYAIYCSDSVVAFALCANSSRKYLTGTHLGTNVWNNLAVNVDRSGCMSLYINGVLVDSEDISGWQGVDISNAQNLNIGRTAGASCYFPGHLDDVAIFQRVLDPDEINIE